jgi:hypothetical protein
VANKTDVIRALNRLAKWRSLLAGWQLGTKPDTDPETQAVRDLQEARLLMRAEVTALTGLLLQKGVFTEDEFTEQVGVEAVELDQAFSRRFPGVESSDHGLKLDPVEVNRAGWMKGWKW